MFYHILHHSVFVTTRICNLLISQSFYSWLYLSKNKTDTWYCFFQFYKMRKAALFAECYWLYLGIFIILFTCNVTIHANHETGYFPLMKLWQTIQFEQQIGFNYFVGALSGGRTAQKECCTENIFLSLPGKMNCQHLMIDICIVIQIVSLALNIRYRSIYNEFR